MIHQLSSSLDSFKSLRFGPGLNIVVADKAAASTSRNTRNGAGEYTLFELINFVFGLPLTLTRYQDLTQLADHRFSVTFDLDGAVITAEEAGLGELLFIYRLSAR